MQIQVQDSAYSSGFRDSRNLKKKTNFFLIVCGFHNISGVSQFRMNTVFKLFVCGIQTAKRSKKSNNVADFSTNLILTGCGTRSQFRKRTAWPRNVASINLILSTILFKYNLNVS